MTSPIPAAGYPSSVSRTQADMQTYFETMLSIAKEQLGGAGEAASVELSSNSFTPGNNACVCVIDTNGLGSYDSLYTITTTNIRDGEVIFIRSTDVERVITVTNGTGGAGQILTGDGNNIVLNSPKLFVALKYNLSITAFEELFRTYSPPSVDLASPGPIGNVTPSSGEFTTLNLTGTVAPSTWLGNSLSYNAAPTFQAITNTDLPSSTVNSVGNLSPLFGASIAGQALSFSISDAAAGTIFGNFGNSTGAPSYNAPGSADQILGVSHSGAGLEYKNLVAGANITITPANGSITIASTGGGGGGFPNPMITLGDTIFGASSGTATRLAGSTSTTKQFLNQTGTGSASASPVWGPLTSADVPWATPGAIGATTPSTGSFTTLALTGNVAAHKWLGNNTGTSAAPSFESITAADLPATTVNSAGSLAPIFTTSVSAQSLNFTLSSAAAGTLLGNFSGTAAAPSYTAPGTNDQVLGVAHTGAGLEYKSIVAGANITITPSAGTITIAATGGGGGGFTNPMTTLGDTIYGASGGTGARLPGNTTTTKEFLTSTGTGTASAEPVWGTLAAGDIPAISLSSTGAGGVTGTLPIANGGTGASTVAAHTWLGNNTGATSAPTFASITSADLPATTVNSVGNLSPLFTSSISTQALNFGLSSANAGTLFGNFSSSAGAPSYQAPGTSDQVLGVAHSGSGLEYKSLVAGSNITITPGAGTLTIAASGGGGTTMPSLVNQLRIYATSGAPFSNNTYTHASVPVPVSTFYIGGRPDGNQCTFNQGSSYQTYGVAETTFTVTGLTASTRYDLYMQCIGGTVATSAAAWTGTSAPPARGADTYGRATKNGDTTSLLIGTFLANTATTASLFTSVSDNVFYAVSPTGMLMPWFPPTATTPIPNGFALCNGASAVWETGPSAGTTFTTPNYIGMSLIGADVPSGTSTANASGFGTTVPGTAYGATTHAHSASLAASVSVEVVGSGTTSASNANAGIATSGSSYADYYHSHTFSVTSTGTGSGSASGTTATASSLPSSLGTVMLIKL